MIIVGVVCAMNPSSVWGQQEFFPFVAQCNEADINIRAGQSTGFEKLGQLKLDEQVVVVDKSYSWYKIRLPKHAKSFITSEYVNLISSIYGEVTAKRVNVRAGAGTNFSVLGQVNKGDRLNIVKHVDDEWYQIQPLDDSYGWVAEEFLKFVSSDVSGFIPAPVEIAAVNDELFVEPSTEIVGEINEQYISEVVELDPAFEAPIEPQVEEIVAPQTEFFGVLTENPSGEGYQYMLVEDGAGTFYLDGFSQLLVPFLNYRVKIEGYIKDQELSGSLPVVVVQRIQLVL